MNARHVRLLVWKEFVQLRRDPMLLRVVMIMPFIYLIMFGYVVAADVTHLRDGDRRPGPLGHEPSDRLGVQLDRVLRRQGPARHGGRAADAAQPR